MSWNCIWNLETPFGCLVLKLLWGSNAASLHDVAHIGDLGAVVLICISWMANDGLTHLHVLIGHCMPSLENCLFIFFQPTLKWRYENYGVKHIGEPFLEFWFYNSKKSSCSLYCYNVFWNIIYISTPTIR